MNKTLNHSDSNLSDKPSSPNAVFQNDEKNLTAIEQIINFNIQKIATIFDDIQILDQNPSTFKSTNTMNSPDSIKSHKD